MKTYFKWLQSTVLAASCLIGVSAQAEDIDIFAGTQQVDTSVPNVIFVLDNTSNWARQAQQWPGGLQQGQSEVRAIKSVLAAQTGKLNVGVMEFTTGGNAADRNGQYVRFALQFLDPSSQTRLNAILDKIDVDINDTTEKKNSPDQYGYILADVYNYLSGGDQSKGGAGTPTDLADGLAGPSTGYKTEWDKFKSPLVTADACVKTYVIFLGNNANGNISSDETTNSNALKALYTAIGESPPDALYGDGNSPAPLPLQQYNTTTTKAPDKVIPAVYGPEVCTTQPAIPISAATAASKSCWKNPEMTDCAADENTTGGLCSGDATGLGLCSCATKGSGTGCSNGKSHYTVTRIAGTKPSAPVCTKPLLEAEKVIPGEITTVVTPTGQPDLTSGKSWNMDDWAKFMNSYGVPFTAEVNGVPTIQRATVVTYTIDVFNAQQEGKLTALFQSVAKVSNGKYFQAKSEDQIKAALNSALGDILADSSSFAAVSLPLSATNRARVDNQVYIGMFRPAPESSPRWYGNLKRYQLALFNGEPLLADVNLHEAINSQDGFAAECAESYWTTDTGTYWQNMGVDPPPFSNCIDIDFTDDPTWSGWSDLPDGPFVEKGGVAQQTREGPAAASRNILTSDSSALRALATTDATAVGGTNVYDYLRGSAAGINEVMPAAGLRSSIHGDVVHSRPLSIRYNSDDIRIYYGANDGLFRAVDPSDGSEHWALVAPEHFGKLSRLYNDSPKVNFKGAQQDPSLTYALKDYFFDGSTGELTHYDDAGVVDQAYIYPTMRRGGRMVYALDVTDPDANPSLLWKVGCPSLSSDTGCTSGYTDIGQTWSMPIGGYVQGYRDGVTNQPKQVVMFGGGFDDCLNAEAAAYPSSCSTAKGKNVYVLDAVSGSEVKKFDTDAPVITELASVDIDFDGYIDFAYTADAAGNLYRINFATQGDADPKGSVASLEPDDWTIVKIGSMSDNTRRFYNAPVVAALQGTVFVTIGSGDRERPLEADYPYASDVQNRFYALIDKPYLTFVDNNPDDGEVTTIDMDGDTMLAVVANPATDMDLQSKDGWYMDLPDRGEQVANPAAIAGGKVFFNTFQPGGASDGLCTKPKGIGTGYGVDLFNPEFTEGNEIEGGGMPIPPVIATVQVPQGLPPCDGAQCPKPADDACASGDCEIVTVCIGCEGFEPIEIIPDADPLRRRLFFTEDVDRAQ